MIIAELNGKTPSKFENREDILTSNVFSFFKYSNRAFLCSYLNQLGIQITKKEAKESKFIFWPVFEDGTEPDLIIICGKYYILFEAKLYSDFSPETSEIDSQINREVKMGKIAAINFGKEFVYIAITAEYNKDKFKYLKVEDLDINFIWTNWQFVADFIEREIDKFKIDEGFAKDLHELLLKKKLRSYTGLLNISSPTMTILKDTVFYNFETSEFKGEFSGFIYNLNDLNKINKYTKFYKRSFFNFSFEGIKTKPVIFYHGKEKK